MDVEILNYHLVFPMGGYPGPQGHGLLLQSWRDQILTSRSFAEEHADLCIHKCRN